MALSAKAAVPLIATAALVLALILTAIGLQVSGRLLYSTGELPVDPYGYATIGTSDGSDTFAAGLKVLADAPTTVRTVVLKVTLQSAPPNTCTFRVHLWKGQDALFRQPIEQSAVQTVTSVHPTVTTLEVPVTWELDPQETYRIGIWGSSQTGCNNLGSVVGSSGRRSDSYLADSFGRFQDLAPDTAIFFMELYGDGEIRPDVGDGQDEEDGTGDGRVILFRISPVFFGLAVGLYATLIPGGTVQKFAEFVVGFASGFVAWYFLADGIQRAITGGG